MIRSVAAFLIVLLNSSAVVLVQAAGFDCKQAQSNVEKLICSNSDVSRLDGELANAYRRILEGSGQKSAITLNQRDWIKKVRNACGTSECLRRVYQERIIALKPSPRDPAPPPREKRTELPDGVSTKSASGSAEGKPLVEEYKSPTTLVPESASKPQERAIHPLVFSMMKAWISDTEEPVVTEISLNSMEHNGNQFSYDTVTVAEGIVEYREVRDGVDERKYYKAVSREGSEFVVDYFENSGGSLTEHVRFRCRENMKHININGALREIRVLQILAIERKN